MGSIVDRTLETYIDPDTGKLAVNANGRKKKRKKAEFKGQPAQYYVTYKDLDGRWRMTKSKATTKEKAKELLGTIEQNVRRGEVGVAERGKEKKFSDAAEHWLKTHSASLTSHHDNVSRMQHLTKAFGKMALGQIDAGRVATFRAKMEAETVKNDEGREAKRWRPNTINRVLALLRKVLNDSVTWGFIKASPRVKLLPVAEVPFDFLHRDEVERFLSHASTAAPCDYPLYAAAVYTGARMGELFGLRWASVDLERGLMTIARSYGQEFTKSKKVRHVRLNKQLVALLKGWRDACPKGAEGLAFPAPNGTMRPRERPPQNFGELLKASRCRPITFHDLRHTCASLLVMAGANLRAVQALLGHSTITVTERYSHLAPSFAQNEADRLSFDLQPGLGQLVVMQGGGA